MTYFTQHVVLVVEQAEAVLTLEERHRCQVDAVKVEPLRVFSPLRSRAVDDGNTRVVGRLGEHATNSEVGRVP